MMDRKNDIHTYFTSDELIRIKQRMQEAGVKNRSAFIRKMVLDGYIVNLNMDEITEMVILLRRCSNNLNQIAKRINATSTIYGAEVSDMQVKQDEIWELAKGILARLATIQ